MDNQKYYNDSFAYDYSYFVKTEKKADILEYPDEKTSAKSRRRTKTKLFSSLAVRVIVAVLVLSAACASLYLRAEISSVQSKINSVNTEIGELNSENVRLEVEIERKTSMTNLEEAAKQLGMQKCEKNQVTYIFTNENDITGTGSENLLADTNN